MMGLFATEAALQGWLVSYVAASAVPNLHCHLHNSAMIHESPGAGSGQFTRLLSPSEKIAHGGNRTRDSKIVDSLPLAP